MALDKQVKFVEEDIVDEETGALVEVSGNSVNPKKEIVPFSEMMEMAKFLANSTIIPQAYQKYPENVLIALDMSNRMGISPMVIMQQMYIIQGKPSFSGQFIATIVQTNPKFEDVELIYVGEEGKDSYGAYVTATDKVTGKTLKGTVVTIGMAKAEKWGSKWTTLATQMLGYRAYTFFGRLYCPAELMGLYATDEIEDFSPQRGSVPNPYKK